MNVETYFMTFIIHLFSILLSMVLIFASIACESGGGGGGGGSSSDSSGGGGGDDDDDSSPITTQGNFRIIFVTDTEVNGSGVASGLGSGLTSMDALCASEMTAKGLGGVFKALVGVGQRKPNGTDWVLRAGKEYRREDLTTVIDVAEFDATANGVIFPFVANGLTNTITATAKYPWTGLNNDWTLDISTNCSDWSRNDYDVTASTLGTYGKSSIESEYVDKGFTQYWGGPLYYNADDNAYQCNTTHPIYCVQTRQLPPPGTHKRLFVSTTTVRGDAGIPAMDSACASDATTKGLSGTYKAVVVGMPPPDGFPGDDVPVRRVCETGNCVGATGMSQAIDWTLLPNTIYVNEDDDMWISTSDEHGRLVDFEEPVPGGSYWTGATNAWAIAASFQHCGGWADTAMNGYYSSGGGISTGTTACTSYLSVLCAEQ